MILNFLYKLNPDDESAQTIMESDTLSPMVSCVEHFWKNLGFEIPYFRYIDFKENGIVIDFGHHSRFYCVKGFQGSFETFTQEWESARRLFLLK